jgi:hypothetical protein
MKTFREQLQEIKDKKCKGGINVIKKRIESNFLDTETGTIKNLVLKALSNYNVPLGDEIALCTESAYFYANAHFSEVKKIDEYRQVYLNLSKIGVRIEREENSKTLLQLLKKYNDEYEKFLKKQQEVFQIIYSHISEKPIYIA